MRKSVWVLIAVLVCFAFVYYSMGQKVFRAEQARMYDKYQKKEITQAEFEAFIATHTLMDVLKTPKTVRSAR